MEVKNDVGGTRAPILLTVLAEKSTDATLQQNTSGKNKMSGFYKLLIKFLTPGSLI